MHGKGSKVVGKVLRGAISAISSLLPLTPHTPKRNMRTLSAAADAIVLTLPQAAAFTLLPAVAPWRSEARYRWAVCFRAIPTVFLISTLLLPVKVQKPTSIATIGSEKRNGEGPTLAPGGRRKE